MLRLSESLPGWESVFRPNVHPVIGVLPGEGIGPEVMQAAMDVLSAVSQAAGIEFDIREGGLIGCAAERAEGQPLTGSVIGFCESIFADSGAILCGPGGGRFVYELRDRFNLHCKLTPIRPYPSLDAGALNAAARQGVDLVVVRENVSGAYFGRTTFESTSRGNAVQHSFRYLSDEVERILAIAIRLARKRSGRLALVVKPGGLPDFSRFWTDRFESLTAGTNLSTRVLEVDNACFQIIQAGAEFDVLVAPNLFGDIVSDVAALHLGSRGLSFSGNFGRRGIAVYQTAHGAAYDLAGQGIANPCGQILALAMLLRESFSLTIEADAIETAIMRVLTTEMRTEDIKSPGQRVVGTRVLGERIAEVAAQQLTALRIAS